MFGDLCEDDDRPPMPFVPPPRRAMEEDVEQEYFEDEDVEREYVEEGVAVAEDHSEAYSSD